MCGIAGIIRRGSPGNIGGEMTSMLQSLKHRGPDSTGFAVYGVPEENQFVMRFKVAEQEDLNSGFDIHQQDQRPTSHCGQPPGGNGRRNHFSRYGH